MKASAKQHGYSIAAMYLDSARGATYELSPGACRNGWVGLLATTADRSNFHDIANSRKRLLAAAVTAGHQTQVKLIGRHLTTGRR